MEKQDNEMENWFREMQDSISQAEGLLDKYREEHKPAVVLPAPATAIATKRYTDMSIHAPDKLSHDCTAYTQEG